MPNNSLMVLAPYRFGGIWVFDDAATGLVKEPFVEGIPEMIDDLVAAIPDAAQGFRLTFSAGPFPRYQSKLIWLRGEYGGNWYEEAGRDREGWLCPALFHYFNEAPKELYVRADPI